jgi:hypothetical protein
MKERKASSSSSSSSSSKEEGHQSPQTKNKASETLYKIFLVLTAFCAVTFLATFASDPIHHENDPRGQRKEVLLKEFLGKGGGGRQRTKGVRGQPSSTNTSTISTGNTNMNHAPQDDSSTPKKDSHSFSSVIQPPPYHIVFSTSCEDQQHWESYVFFYHAHKVQQPGSVTRIVSGCTDKEGQELQIFHEQHIRPLSDNFHVHFTPDFSKGQDIFGSQSKKGRYKYMNKPYGLRHWMESTFRMNETDHPIDAEDGIVILMDPDMILLRPIVHDYTNEDVTFVDEHPATKVVKHGMPIAQQDGYLSNQWMDLNASYVTNGGNIQHIKPQDGPKHYNTGPPYLATVRDMYQIATLWTAYAPRVYEIHPKLFAEMFGYIFATTQLNLPHTLLKSLVVSTTGSHSREGWSYVDALPDDKVCLTSPTAGGLPLPVGLHYCKRYMLEKWFFSKYRLKKKYISCETPLLTPPPLDLATRNYTRSIQPPPNGYKIKEGEPLWNPEIETFSSKQAKREAFMICGLISAVNEAAIHFKKTFCHGTANMAMNYTFFSDPDSY